MLCAVRECGSSATVAGLCSWHDISSKCHVEGCRRPPQTSPLLLYCNGHRGTCRLAGCTRKRKRFVLCEQHARTRVETQKIAHTDLNAARTLLALSVS